MATLISQFAKKNALHVNVELKILPDDLLVSLTDSIHVTVYHKNQNTKLQVIINITKKISESHRRFHNDSIVGDEEQLRIK